MNLEILAKLIIVFAIVLLVVGGVLLVLAKVGKGIGIGKLPGDIHIKKGNFEFYFPLATCIILSVVLTILLNLIFIFLSRR